MNFLSENVTLNPVLPYDLVSWQYWWGIIKLKVSSDNTLPQYFIQQNILLTTYLTDANNH